MSQSPDCSERQQHPRHQTLCPGRILVDGRELDCEVLNISVGGAKIRLGEPVETDSAVELKIPRIGDFSGRVAWRNGATLGVEFHDKLREVARIVEDILGEDHGLEERRTYPRTSVLWAGRLWCGAQVVGCRVLNISATGAKIRCDRPFNTDPEVLLKIHRFGEFAATVVWRGGTDLGIQFKAGPEHIIRLLGDAVPAIRHIPKLEAQPK